MQEEMTLKDTLVTNIATVLFAHLGVTKEELRADPEKYLWVIEDAWKIARDSMAVVTGVSA